MLNLADVLRSHARVLEALADEVQARDEQQGAPNDPLLTDREVASLLRVHPKDVCRWRRQGVLPAVYPGKRRPRTPRSAVERFVKARTVGAPR